MRNINQDNFWCAGHFLKSENDGLESPESGKADCANYPAFAVFDGMGGEQYGEMAAYIAAETFDTLQKSKKNTDTKNFLLDSFKQMNGKITAYEKQNSLGCVGTTAAMIIFGKKEICACNVGDSKIYHYHHGDKNLVQISKDHVMDIFGKKKPPLTQFLGIPESEFFIEPHISHGLYSDGDYYLICSDGLTDMLSEDEIKKTIAQNGDVGRCVERLLESALDSGGRDNITIILCKIIRQKILFGII